MIFNKDCPGYEANAVMVGLQLVGGTREHRDGRTTQTTERQNASFESSIADKTVKLRAAQPRALAKHPEVQARLEEIRGEQTQTILGACAGYFRNQNRRGKYSIKDF
jgi:hypothetical protein